MSPLSLNCFTSGPQNVKIVLDITPGISDLRAYRPYPPPPLPWRPKNYPIVGKPACLSIFINRLRDAVDTIKISNSFARANEIWKGHLEEFKQGCALSLMYDEPSLPTLSVRSSWHDDNDKISPLTCYCTSVALDTASWHQSWWRYIAKLHCYQAHAWGSCSNWEKQNIIIKLIKVPVPERVKHKITMKI